MSCNGEYDNNQSWNEISFSSSSSSNPNSELTDYTQCFKTELYWETRKDMIADLEEVARKLGFFLSIKRSVGNDGEKSPYVEIACDKSGVYRKKKPSSTNSGTKKTDCPFLIRGYKLDKEWRCYVENGFHNHPPATYLQGQARAARLSEPEKELVKSLSETSCKVRDILKSIQLENPENVSNTKTISNYMASLRVKERDGRSQTQHLFHLLNEHHYTFYSSVDRQTNCLENLFFAHPDSVRLFKAFPDVLLMDCTYRTNRFNMSFLEVVGMTSTNQTFCIGFVFMRSETTQNYIWALERFKDTLVGCAVPRVIVTDRDFALMNALHTVFPESHHLLCTFHISKNLLKHSKKVIPKEEWQTFLDDWHLVVESETEEDYNHYAAIFISTYSMYPDVVSYVSQLLNDVGTKFVACYTNRTTHLGNRTSNRAEGQHAKLKSSIATNTGNLQTVWTEVNKILKKQFDDIKNQLDRCKSYFPHAEKTTVLTNLRSYVSHHAFNLIFEEEKKCVGQFGGSCSCGIKFSHGLPCHHDISLHLALGKSILLENIHRFWRKLDVIDDNGSNDDDEEIEGDLTEFRNVYSEKTSFGKRRMKTQLRDIVVPFRTSMHEPEVRQSKGRPRKGDTSSKRDKSGFEYAEEEVGRRDKGKNKTKETPILSTRTTSRTTTNLTSPPRQTFMYSEQIWHMLHDYIDTVNDVRGDGNCGFRVIAKVVGKPNGENDWFDVRCELFHELHDKQAVYKYLFDRMGGEEFGFDYIAGTLDWSNHNEIAPFDKWFKYPALCYLVSSLYNFPLVYLTRDQDNATFLPLFFGPPPDLQSYNPVVMVYVNNCHYAEVIPKRKRFPLPPIINEWEKISAPDAKPWKEYFLQNFKHYKALQRKDGKQHAPGYVDMDPDS